MAPVGLACQGWVRQAGSLSYNRTMTPSYPYFLANKKVTSSEWLPVLDKFRGGTVAKVALADSKAIDRAIEAAVQAQTAMRRMSSHERRSVLALCVEKLAKRQEEFAQVLCREAGKPIRDSRVEVSRALDTFRVAMEECTRFGGEVMPLDISPRAEGYRGFFKRVPVGPCSFIAPFNFPLNLVAHKIAPALAVGCPFILKPASFTPLVALLLGEILAETPLPEGAFSILPCRREAADLFTTDERLKLLSFTGSAEVGWDLKARSGKKRVVLELGGNAACIVEPDWDVADAVDRLLVGAFYQSGQSCIKVQRVLVHESVYAVFRNTFLERAALLRMGDPSDEQTQLGPLISEAEAERVQDWVDEAKGLGAKVLLGGTRRGALFPATVLEKVPHQALVYREEVFGPVVVLEAYREFDAALGEVNSSRFGLQAGVLTRDIYKAMKAWDTLEVGGVVIGDIPSWRVDNMPYGGVKDSGLGREGVRFAMEEMSEVRLLALRTPKGV